MSYNEKSRENLVPFKTGHDSRRRVGRKKGSLNQRTVIKNLLYEGISPDMIFSPTTRERLRGMSGRSYIEAITATLINQSLDGNPQASNILMRELRKIEEKEPHETNFDKTREIKIVTVSSEDEINRLNAIESDLERRYGDDYEDMVNYATNGGNRSEWASGGF